MSLNHKTFPQVVRVQTKWKVKAYSQALVPLLILQIIMAILTSSGSGTSSMTMNQVSIESYFYSLDVFLISTCIWAVITAFLIQTRGYRQTDLSAITNRATGNTANIISLIFFSFIAVIVNYMSLYILVASIQLIKGIDIFPNSELFNFMQFLVAFFIILLAASSGYFISSLFNLSKILGSLFVLVGGFLCIRVLDEQLLTIVKFYFEAGYFLFLVKALITAALLFALPVVFLNGKEEVRE